MTQPNSPNRHHVPADVTDRWRSRWLVPLTPTALGAVILVASATHGHPISGLVWFAALAAVGAVSAMAERLQTARRSGRHAADEREAIINSRAMSIAGTVLVIALTALHRLHARARVEHHPVHATPRRRRHLLRRRAGGTAKERALTTVPIRQSAAPGFHAGKFAENLARLGPPRPRHRTRVDEARRTIAPTRTWDAELAANAGGLGAQRRIATMYPATRNAGQTARSAGRSIAAPAATWDGAARSLLGAECGHEIRADRVTALARSGQHPGLTQIGVEQSSRALVTASVETCLCCRTGIFAPPATVSECAESRTGDGSARSPTLSVALVPIRRARLLRVERPAFMFSRERRASGPSVGRRPHERSWCRRVRASLCAHGNVRAALPVPVECAGLGDWEVWRSAAPVAVHEQARMEPPRCAVA